MSVEPSESWPRLRKAERLTGERLVLRNAALTDAAFIHGLRLDTSRNAFMSATPPALAAQQAWLTAYAQDDEQAYFVIEDATGHSLGTVRLYDARGDSFCWGSWLMRPGAPVSAATESALMVYAYASHLGFRRAHFTVHEDNLPVRRFHERFGAQAQGRQGDQIVYALEASAMRASMARLARFLPHGIRELHAAPGSG